VDMSVFTDVVCPNRHAALTSSGTMKTPAPHSSHSPQQHTHQQTFIIATGIK